MVNHPAGGEPRTPEDEPADRPDAVGREIHALISELYPICRSITGNGLRETLRRIGRRIPIEIHEVPTGTKVFDWTVPKEWNISDAYIKSVHGDRIVDFKRSNLHVMSYSVPVRATMPLAELQRHLHTLPDQPEVIPYRTSYYNESWGFCLEHNRMLEMRDEAYDVCIESSLADGALTYAECVLPGTTADEVLVSCHACHPSLCNDNLSGVAIATFLAKHLGSRSRRLSYRFVFIPGTIGSITWLSRNEAGTGRIKHGFVLTCAGDPGRLTYKRSRRGDAYVDRAFAHVLARSGEDHEIIDFFPYGYDERQYGSPGFNLPVGCLMRTPHGRFPQYHTSADDLDFVKPRYLGDTFSKCLAVFDILEQERVYRNTNPKCEPQLGRRGLYEAIGGAPGAQERQLAMLWVLNLSDGSHGLLDVAERSGLSFAEVRQAADTLRDHDLLREV